jgi:type II secretory pathway pseudopilin PulG
MEPHRRTKYTATSAFTLRELVVVMAVLSLLGGTLIVSMQRAASWRIKKAQCAANLRQFAQATQLYATENRDKLPDMTTIGSYWVWDLPNDVADALLRYGMTQRSFYCPGTAPRFDDLTNFRNPSPNSLWNYFGNAATRVTGYAHTFSQASLVMSNRNTTILPELARVNSFISYPAPPNHERVLLADATISQNQAGTAAAPVPAGSFTSIAGGFQVNGSTVPHLSPHLKGILPAGGNLAYKDGHVAWREFKHMAQRATGIIGPGPGFWW